MSMNAENAHRQWETDEEYVATGGCHCPSCGSTNIDGHSVDIDAGYATQDVSCHDCDAEWTDQYKLIGYN